MFLPATPCRSTQHAALSVGDALVADRAQAVRGAYRGDTGTRMAVHGIHHHRGHIRRIAVRDRGTIISWFLLTAVPVLGYPGALAVLVLECDPGTREALQCPFGSPESALSNRTQ